MPFISSVRKNDVKNVFAQTVLRPWKSRVRESGIEFFGIEKAVIQGRISPGISIFHRQLGSGR